MLFNACWFVLTVPEQCYVYENFRGPTNCTFEVEVSDNKTIEVATNDTVFTCVVSTKIKEN